MAAPPHPERRVDRAGPPCTDRPAPPAGSPPPPWRDGRTARYFFLTGMIAPASDLVTGDLAAPGPAVAVLIGFAACFVLVSELSRRPDTAGPGWQLTRARRRILGALNLAMLVLALTTTATYGRGWWVLFMFVAPTLTFAVPVRWAGTAIAGVAAIAAATMLIRRGWHAPGIAEAVSCAMPIAMSGFVALLLRRRSLLIDDLRFAHGEVARLAAADAVVDERLRIARDLHDLLGHSLSVIALKSELARRLLEPSSGHPPDRARAEIDDVEQIARRALIEVREAVTGYRARTLETELARARAALEAADVAVTTRIAAPALAPELDDLLAWIVREATTNIVRHSHARRAEIELTEADGVVRLEVRNDGVADRAPGPSPRAPTGGAVTAGEPAASGHGLVGLRERTAELGGLLTAAADGERFRVTVLVPLGAPTLGAPTLGAPTLGAPPRDPPPRDPPPRDPPPPAALATTARDEAPQ